MPFVKTASGRFGSAAIGAIPDTGADRCGLQTGSQTASLPGLKMGLSGERYLSGLSSVWEPAQKWRAPFLRSIEQIRAKQNGQ